MNNATTILTLPIVEIAEGRKEGMAYDIILDSVTKEVYLLMEGERPGISRILNMKKITGIGKNYILVPDRETIRNQNEEEEVMKILENCFSLLEVDVVNVDGTFIGRISDFGLEEKKGEIVELILDDGTCVKGSEIVSVCEKIVFVNTSERGTKKEKTAGPALEIVESSSESEYSKILDEIDYLDEEEQQESKSDSPEGLVLTTDVRSMDGKFTVAKGTVVTEELMKEAEEHDALVTLAMYAE